MFLRLRQFGELQLKFPASDHRDDFRSVLLSPLAVWVVREGSGSGKNMRDDSAEILFQTLLREAIVVSSSGLGRDVHCFDVVRPAFLLPSTEA